MIFLNFKCTKGKIGWAWQDFNTLALADLSLWRIDISSVWAARLHIILCDEVIRKHLSSRLQRSNIFRYSHTLMIDDASFFSLMLTKRNVWNRVKLYQGSATAVTNVLRVQYINIHKVWANFYKSFRSHTSPKRYYMV